MLPVLLLALSSFSPQTPPSAPAALAASDTGRTIAMAARKAGRLPVENRVRPVTLARFDLPDAPFTTYYAALDLAPSFTRTAGGTVVRFSPKDGSGLAADAVAEFVFPDGDVSAEALAAATFGPGGAAARQGWRVDETGVTPCLWADEGRLITFGADRSGFVCVGSHDGRAFRFTVQSPEDQAEAFGRHVDVVLNELRWRPSGAPLEG